MYIRGLTPGNFTELAKVVLIDSFGVTHFVRTHGAHPFMNIQRMKCIPQNLRNAFHSLEVHERMNAMTWNFHQCGILTSVDSDKPVQPPFKLRSSK